MSLWTTTTSANPNATDGIEPLPSSSLAAIPAQNQPQSQSQLTKKYNKHNKLICDPTYYTHYKYCNNHYYRNNNIHKDWRNNRNNGHRYLTHSLPGSLVNFLNHTPLTISTRSNSHHNSPLSSISVPTTTHSNDSSRSGGFEIGVAVGTTSAIASSIFAHSVNDNNYRPKPLNYKRQSSQISQSQLLNYTSTNPIKNDGVIGFLQRC